MRWTAKEVLRLYDEGLITIYECAIKMKIVLANDPISSVGELHEMLKSHDTLNRIEGHTMS